MSMVNFLSREKQIEIVAAFGEGVGQRAVTRLTGTDRKTVARLALRVGRGCAELHDRLMIGIRVNRLELDEAWSFVGKKQKNVLRHEIFAKGDQYVFIGMAGTQKAIIGWRVGKRNADTTLEFLHDLRGRVIGQPEISTDGFLPYRNSIRDTFGDTASHGVIVKTYSVTHLVKEAQGRYSPAEVVAVAREVVSGDADQSDLLAFQSTPSRTPSTSNSAWLSLSRAAPAPGCRPGKDSKKERRTIKIRSTIIATMASDAFCELLENLTRPARQRANST